MSDESNMKPIGDEGGYDLVELKEAKEAFEEKHGDEVKTSGLVDVEPILIQVSNEIVVEQKEYEARTVLIEYDAYGEVVSVELL